MMEIIRKGEKTNITCSSARHANMAFTRRLKKSQLVNKVINSLCCQRWFLLLDTWHYLPAEIFKKKNNNNNGFSICRQKTIY